MNLLLGGHLSIAKGLGNIHPSMLSIGADCCAIFLKNQRRYVSKGYDARDIDAFKSNGKRLIVPHGSYLINMGSSNSDIRDKSYDCLVDDLKRCNTLGIELYNLHPGSDTQKMGIRAYDLVVEMINKVHNEVQNVTILIENMAGQGNVLGSSFDDINRIIKGVSDKSRIGVCLDTCHMYGAGYDVTNFPGVMEIFDKKVGIEYLKAMHLNDSKEPLGSRKDRHEQIGKGMIGINAFKQIVNYKQCRNIPMILETPDPKMYKEEIELLRSMAEF